MLQIREFLFGELEDLPAYYVHTPLCHPQPLAATDIFSVLIVLSVPE